MNYIDYSKITKLKYLQENGVNVSVDVTSLDPFRYTIPLDEDNTDYQEVVKRWLDEGNTIEAAD